MDDQKFAPLIGAHAYLLNVHHVQATLRPAGSHLQQPL